MTSAEGQDLIAEIGARGDDNGLVVAFARAAFARTYTLEGDLVRAEAELLDAQKTIVTLLGAEHTRNLMVLSDLFDVASQRSDWPKALDYAQRVRRGDSAAESRCSKRRSAGLRNATMRTVTSMRMPSGRWKCGSGF